jgi:hypothetical protein
MQDLQLQKNFSKASCSACTKKAAVHGLGTAAGEFKV